MVKNKIVVKAVIGANYGDEGKGLMADYFCHKAQTYNMKCLNVCTNGGAQRGHTVELSNGTRHIFSHFGSGTFCNADTYLPATFILNPILFRNEYEKLEEFNVTPKAYVHPECIWTTPYDMILNQIKEEMRGGKKHGSCGVGIWETIKRCSKTKHITIRAFYELSYNEKKLYLNKIKEYMLKNLCEVEGKIPDRWDSIITSDNLIKNFIDDFNYMYEHILQIEERILEEYNYIVFENGQGLLLDRNCVPIENTTPSNTGIKDIVELIKSIKKDCEIECCYVTRSYLTRHGAGPFPQECDKNEINPKMLDKTNKENVHQGKLRYGRISVSELKDRIYKDSSLLEEANISLAVTHLNETGDRFADREKTTVESLLNSFDGIYKSNGTTRESVCEVKNEIR